MSVKLVHHEDSDLFVSLNGEAERFIRHAPPPSRCIAAGLVIFLLLHDFSNYLGSLLYNRFIRTDWAGIWIEMVMPLETVDGGVSPVLGNVFVRILKGRVEGRHI